MNKPIDTVGNRITKALIYRNMKPVDLVNKTGISKASISQYMSDRVAPKTERLMEIAKALEVTETWLLGFDVEMDVHKSIKDEAERDVELLDMFHKLDAHDKDIVMNLLRIMSVKEDG